MQANLAIIMEVNKFLLSFSLLTSTLTAQSGLDIFFVDVEGGGATLIVTPEKESILVDTGWKRGDRRDPIRIQEAMQLAGLKQIDYLITTHFHRDHYGGTLQLSEMIPIRSFLDHGPMTSLREDAQFKERYAEYERAHGGKRRSLSPGETIPLKQGSVPLKVTCLASDGKTISRSGPPNSACANLPQAEEDPSDNARSVGIIVQFGNFEFLDLGDLTWKVEARLVCPTNLIGRVDAYQVTHHGLSNSSNPVLVRSIQPTVSIINNGPKKGGHPQVFSLLKSVSSIQDIFQGHRNIETGPENNTDPDLIANLGSEEGCSGNLIQLSVSPDARSFTVTNGRNGSFRHYEVQ